MVGGSSADCGAGSCWGRKKVEKETPLLRGSGRPCAKLPDSQALQGRCSGSGPQEAQANGLHVESCTLQRPALHGALLGAWPAGPGPASGQLPGLAREMLWGHPWWGLHEVGWEGDRGGQAKGPTRCAGGEALKERPGKGRGRAEVRPRGMGGSRAGVGFYFQSSFRSGDPPTDPIPLQPWLWGSVGGSVWGGSDLQEG